MADIRNGQRVRLWDGSKDFGYAGVSDTDNDGGLYVRQHDGTALLNTAVLDSAAGATDGGIVSAAVRNDTLASLVSADGDYAPLQVNAAGALYVDVSNASVTVDDGGGSITVDGTVSTNAEYAEDSAHTTADVGNFVLAVRNDAGGPLAGTTGDYIPFTTDATGALRVTGGAANASVIVDDTAFTPATSSVTAVGFFADETAPDSVDEGDIGAARMTLDRRQLMVLTDGTTDSQRLAINSSGEAEVLTNFEYAEDSVHTTADVGVQVLSVRNDTLASLVSADGDYAPLQVNADGALYIDVSNASVTVDDGGGSLTIDGTVTTNTEYAEDTAHTTGDIGTLALAVRNDAGTPLAGTTLDYIPFTTDATGALRVTGGAANASVIVDDTAFTPAVSSVTAAGFFADETAPDSVDEGDIGAARMTLDRKQLMVIADPTTDANRWAIDASGLGQVDLAAVSVTAVPVSKDSSANSETNPIYVTNVDTAVSASEIHDYDTSAAVAKDATDTHTYTVANTTFLLKSVIVAASGAMRVQIEVDSVVVATIFTSGSRLTEQIFFDPPLEAVTDVDVNRRNDDNQPMDVYSTIIGNDI
jgi:hypothetical protein